jgi:GPH family glycoside/pentoside/hexuronide:cation symporter
MFLTILGEVFASASISYYALYVLNDLETMTWINLVIGIASIVISLVMIFIGAKIGTRVLFVAGLLGMAVGRIGLGIVGNENQPLLNVLFIIIGVGFGLTPIAVATLAPRIIHYSQKKKGKLVPGVGSAVNNTSMKLAMGLGTVIFGFLMSAAGFDAALDAQGIAQPAAVTTAINMGFCWIPAVIYIAESLLLVFFFDIDKKMKELEDGLRA